MSTPRHPDTGQYTPGDLAPVPPPTSPGDVPADTSMWGAERDPADNLGISEPVPSVADSPHWREMSGRQ